MAWKTSPALKAPTTSCVRTTKLMLTQKNAGRSGGVQKAADVCHAIPRLTGNEAGAVIADKRCNCNRPLAFTRNQEAGAAIQPKSNRKGPWKFGREDSLS